MNSVIGQVLKVFAVVLSVALCAACESVNGKVGSVLNLDTNLKLQLLAGTSINPDEQEKSSPVFVRLYELNATGAFEGASFIDLYERDEEILGDTFIAKQELKRIIPGNDSIERFVLSKETRYVALFAEFYQYKDAQAKVIFPVTSNNVIRNAIKVTIEENRLKLGNK